jgi:hypothetical protein
MILWRWNDFSGKGRSCLFCSYSSEQRKDVYFIESGLAPFLEGTQTWKLSQWRFIKDDEKQEKRDVL